MQEHIIATYICDKSEEDSQDARMPLGLLLLFCQLKPSELAKTVLGQLDLLNEA